MEGDLSYQQRIDIAGSLSGSLNGQECDALIAGMLESRPLGVPAGIHSTWFHVVGGILQRESQVRERFARALAGVAMEGGHEPVYRDYALQHLRLVWNHARGQDALRASIVATFLELARDGDIGASALLSLHLVGEGGEGARVPDAVIAPILREGLDVREARDPPWLLTALRIAGERQMERFHADARRIAADPEASHAMVRMAAIAAVSKYRDPADLEFLKSIPAEDRRIAGSLQAAIRRISGPS